MFSRYIHITASYEYFANFYWWIVPLFIYPSSMGIWLFSFFSIMNNATWTFMCKFCMYMFFPFLLGIYTEVELLCHMGTLHCRRPGFNSEVGKIPGRRIWQPAPVFLPGRSHGQRSVENYSSWSRKELGITEWLSLSLIGTLCVKIWKTSKLLLKITVLL